MPMMSQDEADDVRYSALEEFRRDERRPAIILLLMLLIAAAFFAFGIMVGRWTVAADKAHAEGMQPAATVAPAN